MRSFAGSLALLSSSMLLACGAPPPPAAPSPAPRPTPAEPPPTIAVASAEPAPDDAPFAPHPEARFARSPVSPTPFRLSDLALGEIPDALSPAAAPATLPSGEEASELAFDWGPGARPSASHRASARIGITSQGLGKIRIGFNEGPISPDGGGGVYVSCGGGEHGPRRPVPARWETLVQSSGGKAKYAVTNAWFDLADCKATVVARASVEATPLANGFVLGYRQQCAACGGGETLVLLAPRTSHVAATATTGDATTITGIFTRVELPLRKGGGVSLLAVVPPESMRDWQKVSAGAHDEGAAHVVGVEVTQGVAEQQATAVAYEGVSTSGPK